MFNDMGYQPPITLVRSFGEVILLGVCISFFEITLRCLTGRSTSMDKVKIQFHSVIAKLYYGMQVDYASLLWVEFVASVSHSNMTTKISHAWF